MSDGENGGPLFKQVVTTGAALRFGQSEPAARADDSHLSARACRSAISALTRSATQRSRSAFASSIRQNRRTPRGILRSTRRAENRHTLLIRADSVGSWGSIHSARRASSKL